MADIREKAPLDPNNSFESEKAYEILTPLKSKEDLRDWMYVYLDLWFPSGVVYPTSTHGPVEAMWRIYELYSTGESEEIPSICMLASRDSYKTLSAAALEVLCMLHFRFSVAHMAAIKSQSLKAVQYVNSFFRKVKKYLEYNDWKSSSDNKNMIEWITDQGDNVYLKIIVATIAGANSEHVPMLCIDGKSKVLIKNPKESNRKRKTVTARGLYCSLNRGGAPKIISFNHKTASLEYKEIESWFKTKKDIHRVDFLDSDKYMEMALSHKTYVNKKGYIPLQDVEVGDEVFLFNKMHSESNIKNDKKRDLPYQVEENSDILNELMIGSLLGDGFVSRRKSEETDRYCNNAFFGENHCIEQSSYLKWKGDIFKESGFHVREGKSAISGYTGKPMVNVTTGNNEYFNKWVGFRSNFHKNGALESMGPLALAIWYQDDGVCNNDFLLCTHSFSEEQVVYLSDLINKRFNFNTRIDWERKEDGRVYPIIRGGSQDKYKLYKICGHLFHESMRYKYENVLKKTIKHCISCESEFTTNESGNNASYCTASLCQLLKTGSIQKLKVKSISFVGNRWAYDFNVKDNHNFFVNGILTHNCIDEVDVVQNPKALEEAKMIPSVYGKYFPLTIYLSTRKFAGGLMEKTIKSVEDAGGEILRWNIIDVTQRISLEDAKASEPRVIRYVSRELPLENLNEKEWKNLPDEKKNRYEKIEAYAGIADHILLPAMHNRLVDRDQSDFGGLFKPLSATRNNFKQLSPEMGEAQLLCNKPSSSGLVYSRFETDKNTLTIQQAWEKITGMETPCYDFEQLRVFLNNLGIQFIGGADWGFTDMTSFVVLAIIPGGEVWLIDSFAMAGLELDDIKKYVIEFQNKYPISKWYADQNYPAYLKALRKIGTFPAFTKVVEDGITAVQGKIVNASNSRGLFVLNTPNNKPVIDAFGEYKWALDGKGDIIEGKPYHDKEGVSDIMDSIRYPFQNLFTKGAKPVAAVTGSDAQERQQKINQSKTLKEVADAANKMLMQDQMAALGVKAKPEEIKSEGKVRKRIMW